MKVLKLCLECGKEFQADEREIRRGNAKFCSLKCSGVHNGKSRIISNFNCHCAQCNKGMWRSASKIAASKSGLLFCSRKCKEEAQRIGGMVEIQPYHYGADNQYRKRAFENFDPVCNSCGYAEHIQVLEVHHKDHDRANNDISNLEILCPTCHREKHLGIKNVT